MKQFMMAYCPYDPDCYVGHRLLNITAETHEDAEKQGWETLAKASYKGLFEYVITEMTPQSSFRQYDNTKMCRN